MRDEDEAPDRVVQRLVDEQVERRFCPEKHRIAPAGAQRIAQEMQELHGILPESTQRRGR